MSDFIIKDTPDHIRKDLRGKTFNNTIKVLGFSERKNGQTYWFTECLKCGKVKLRTSGNLPRTKQCSSCSSKIIGKSNLKHGMSKTPLYKKWQSFTTTQDVCTAWSRSFESFYTDMISSYCEDTPYIVRIDFDYPHSKKNSRWSKYRETELVEVQGRKVFTGEAMELLGVGRERVRQIRNRQKGLCKCGKQPTPGYKTCSQCRKPRKTK